MGADSADHRQCQVSPVGLDAHRCGRKRHPIGVAALLLEPREADTLAGPRARRRGLPVPVRLHRTVEAIGVGLFRAFRPPHRAGLGVDAHVVFDGVEAFAQHRQRRLRGRDPGCLPRLDVGFQGGHRLVERLASGAEMPRQRAGLVLGRVQREPKRLHTPPVGDLQTWHLRPPRRHRPPRPQGHARLGWPQRVYRRVERTSSSESRSYPAPGHRRPRRSRPRPAHGPGRRVRLRHTQSRTGRTDAGAPPLFVSPVERRCG